MAALKEIAREWASELREGIAWVIVWKTGRGWNAQAVWLNCEDEKLEPEDLGLARKVLNQDKNAVMLNGYYCGRFFEEMTVEDVAAAIRWHYENGYNKLDGSDVFPDEANQDTADQTAALAWMDEAQQEDFREICGMIDSIKSGRDFYRVMNQINSGRYSVDVINAAREFKQCFNSAQYEPEAHSAGTLVAAAADTVERAAAADVEPQPIALAYMDDLGVARCGECGAELLCNETGDMPDVCPACGRRLEYDFFREPEGPDADAYRTRADNQQGTGTAAEAASEGRETALGTPEAMAGTDATEAAGGQQPPPQAGEIDLGRLYAGTRLEAMEQEEGKQPGGP